jgi:hypothetical protein
MEDARGKQARFYLFFRLARIGHRMFGSIEASISCRNLSVVATHEHGKWHVCVIPQKEPYFPPPDRRAEHREVKVGIISRPRSDKDVHIAQGHCFCA